MALRVGLVGLRGIGVTHASAYKNDPLGELVAVCDVIRERADSVAEQFGVRAYYRLTDLLRNEEVDIIDVTTGGYENGSWHFEPVMEAIEAGKHVLVEKPLSNDIREARQMVARATEKGVYLGCNLNHYFTPPAERARQYMDEGRVGELVYCLHKMGFSAGEGTYQPNRNARWWDLPYAHFKAFLSHPFSVMRHFCGDITHVQAFVNRPGVRRTARDVMLSTVSIHVRFANDCVGYLLSQRGDATYGLGGWWSLEVAGTRGTFCIENCIEKVTFWPAPGTGEAGDPAKMSGGTSGGPEVTHSGITDFSQTFPRRIHAFLEDITNGVHPENLRASGRDALAALEYTWAAMESYELGGALVRPHPLPPLHGDPRTMVD
ncbi:MAG: Gfo/Idh/MocA family oxidoreductase [Chloroherpetonaceae bacterium]|nr:Gfo/Idh/MocA family oxidoreductase [Chthonomonadaceae bacterium]MDW8207190.1 Gfo/Idh/MocA family oxidoreductase [Chloroherpetonaceae bacterium]